VTTASVGLACPRCAEPTVTLGLTHPWCAACDWNLDRTIPAGLGWKWLDRRLHRVAVRLTTAQFTTLAEGPALRRSVTAARLVTLVAAGVLLAAVLAIAVLGGWLLVREPGFVAKLLGVLLLGVAVVLRPRFHRLATLTEDAQPVDRAAAPELFALIGRVAGELGTPLPQILLVGPEMNAFTTTVGLRRRRVLYLGLPLWATLAPQERVALLGHELGHFVNGDVRRAPLTVIARTTLGQVAELLEPSLSNPGGIIEALTRTVGRLLARVTRLLQLLLLWTSLRDSQRAEYLADEMGARAGGTPAAIALADQLVLADPIDTVVRREARAGNDLPAWRAAAAAARTNQAPNVAPMRRLSRHTEASLFASHPPTGLRAEMLERRPAQPAAIVLDEDTAARIDTELIPCVKSVRRALAS
jgi:heat shock protein HtpX